MVEVFSTNINTEKNAVAFLILFKKEYPAYRINFDLEDCDNVLRVQSETSSIDADGIISIIKASGYYAQVMSAFPAAKIIEQNIE